MSCVHSVMLVFSPILSGSTLPPSPFPVYISILYTRIQCVRGALWCSGPEADKHLPQSPFYMLIFLDGDVLHSLLWVLYFYGRSQSILQV